MNLESKEKAMASQDFDVILLGHFAKDEDIVDGKERDVLGGAVYYGAFSLKLMGIKVAVVTKLARKDFFELSIFKDVEALSEELELSKR